MHENHNNQRFNTTHILLINIGAGFSNALQAFAYDGHHVLLCVREQDVALG